MDKFSVRLYELRKEKGMTGEELAKIVGVNKATISKYENGKLVSPTLPILQKLSDCFNVCNIIHNKRGYFDEMCKMRV